MPTLVAEHFGAQLRPSRIRGRSGPHSTAQRSLRCNSPLATRAGGSRTPGVHHTEHQNRLTSQLLIAEVSLGHPRKHRLGGGCTATLSFRKRCNTRIPGISVSGKTHIGRSRFSPVATPHSSIQIVGLEPASTPHKAN